MIEETIKVNPKSFAIFTSIAICSIIILRRFFSKPGLRLPPGPIALPIIGHLHLLSPIPHQALHKLSLRYGPLISLRLGSVPCVVASSPEIAKEFLKTNELFFANRPQSKAVGYLTYGSADFSFAPFGAYWKFMKKLSMSELLGGQTLEQLSFIRDEEVVRILLKLQTKAREKMKVDLSGELMRMSNNVICRMTMSRSCSEDEEEAEEVRKLVEETEELMGKFNLADYIGFCKNFDLQGFDKRVEDVHRRFDRTMERILEEKKALRRTAAAAAPTSGGSALKDILDILLDTHEDENAEMKLSLENIKAYILDIFAAGTDTSALTMEWALSELINNPGVLKKLREEIDTVVGKNRLISEMDTPNMPYLQAIIKETLRLHPTGPMTVRECTKDCKINGYNIQAKTRVFVNIWAIGRDPSYWKEPLKFMPERFMEEGSDGNIDVRGQHFHMIPFGSGRRSCPGVSLALLVVQAGVGALVQCFDWEVDGGEGGMVDMTEGPGLTLPRAKPLVCTPVLRLNPLPLRE